MGDVVVGHGENGNLGNGAAAAFDHAGPLIQGGKVGIQIAGIAFPAGDFSFGGRKLPAGLRIGGHIRHHHQDMHIQVKSQVFRRRQGTAGSEDAFDNGIVGEIEEHGHSAQHAAFLKAAPEEIGYVVGNAHGGEDNGEFRSLVVGYFCLADDLSGQLVMLHA